MGNDHSPPHTLANTCTAGRPLRADGHRQETLHKGHLGQALRLGLNTDSWPGVDRHQATWGRQQWEQDRPWQGTDGKPRPARPLTRLWNLGQDSSPLRAWLCFYQRGRTEISFLRAVLIIPSTLLARRSHPPVPHLNPMSEVKRGCHTLAPQGCLPQLPRTPTHPTPAGTHTMATLLPSMTTRRNAWFPGSPDRFSSKGVFRASWYL